MAVTTSIVVQFSQGGAGGSLSAEIDSREAGFNAGKSSFFPGETATFLVFKTPDVVLDEVSASSGSIGIPVSDPHAGLFSVEDEWITFAGVSEASTAKLVHSGFTYQWFGNNLGAVTVVGGKVVAPLSGVGMLKVSYKAKYVPYSLASPSVLNGKSDFQIAVLVKGHSDA